MTARHIALAIALVGAAVVIAAALGAQIPGELRSLAGLVSSLAVIAYAVRIRGRFALFSPRLPRAAYESDGWRKDTFVMDGLEEEALELQESTAAAVAHGYRRERTSDKYAWRFIREAQPE